MKTLKVIALVLVIIGGLNWGLMGINGTDLVLKIFGGSPVTVKVIYDLVGLSALLLIFARPKVS